MERAYVASEWRKREFFIRRGLMRRFFLGPSNFPHVLQKIVKNAIMHHSKVVFRSF